MARRRSNQSKLAAKLGVTEPWVSRRLNGKTDLTIEDLYRIAAVLEVDAVELLPRITVTTGRYPVRPTPHAVSGMRPAGERRPCRLAT